MRPIPTTCSSMTARSTATSSACAASSARWIRSSAVSRRCTAPVTASPMAEEAAQASRFERLPFPPRASLTTRILAVNLIPLLILAGSLFFLDSYRRQLLEERFKLARIEAQITAEALAGATKERQEALL